MSSTPDLLVRLHDLLGPAGLLVAPEDVRPFLTDWRGLWHGEALAVARPSDTAQAADAIALCRAAGCRVTLQGGNTSLVGGSVPDQEPGAEPGIVIQTGRLTAPPEVDHDGATLVAGAGITLEQAERAARADGLRIGLRLGSEGTAQLGGLVATNAGGSHAMRFGMMRAQVLGVDAVLPDGSVHAGTTRLRKDNFGWDLSQLFIGSEGAFGLITAVSLALQPRPVELATALLELSSLDRLPELLRVARARLGSGLERVEFMSGAGLRLAREHVLDLPPYPGTIPDWSVIVELGSVGADRASAALETLMETLFEAGTIVDGVLAASLAQAEAFWTWREATVEGQRRHGLQLKHDVAVPPSRLPDFIAAADAALARAHGSLLVNAFGHAGDGNVHYNVSPGEQADPDRDERITATVHRLALEHGGTIAAEHGVGRLKRARYLDSLGPAERTLLTTLRTGLDPRGLFNPHILPLASGAPPDPSHPATPCP